jgi:adenosylhomocysteine nucleosidase
MEGYALAMVAHEAGVPVRLVKHISDQAGENAVAAWRKAVEGCAHALALWTREHLLRGF